MAPVGQRVKGAKSKSGQLAQSDGAIVNLTDAAVIPAMVKVDVDPVASYTGGVKGLAATSPEITGKKLSLSDPAVKAYLRYVDEKIAAATAAIHKAIPSVSILSTYRVAYGGLVVKVPARDAKALLSVPGVAAVQNNALQSCPQR
ncbi:hypothetical protein ATY41_01495 [Leifsonia xyli subsp. xyli]|uniref:Uncharacterized protein n=1 Tax=Leifsonia xyli subsp. xyli TaxID=59736 RepID=A0A1E2SNM6_LEIXY|nr:hypothetical protein [Leifsonia xyli]ODA91380.1 hypothetical protein ATY41_01495 [Leifsonia xyli subsp. xyli]